MAIRTFNDSWEFPSVLLAELEYQLLLSKDLGFLPEQQYLPLCGALAELGRMLVALRQKVREAQNAKVLSSEAKKLRSYSAATRTRRIP